MKKIYNFIVNLFRKKEKVVRPYYAPFQEIYIKHSEVDADMIFKAAKELLKFEHRRHETSIGYEHNYEL